MRRKRLVMLAAFIAPVLVLTPMDASAQSRNVHLYDDYYVGINWTGWSIDAMANCRRDAAQISGGAYRATCTATVYGARLSVYQS